MLTIKGGKVKTLKTRAAFTNVASRRRPVLRAVRSKPRTQKRTHHAPVRRGADRVDKPLLSQSTVDAAKAAMAAYYPAKYRDAIPPSPDLINMPVVPITVTDKWQFTTILSASGWYENLFVVDPYTVGTYKYGLTYAGNNVATIASINCSAASAISSMAESYRVTAIDIRIQPNVKSADIQGEWGAYNFPYGTGPVGLSAAAVDTYAGVGRGMFTDADPSARFVWLAGDSTDATMKLPASTVGPYNTCTWFSVRTSSPITCDAVITLQLMVKPSVVGQAVIPGEPRNTDLAAYQRGMAVFNDVIQENNSAVTNPARADENHAGILKRVARAVAKTIQESEMIISALTGSPMLARGLSATAGAIGSLFRAKSELAAIISMAQMGVADRIREEPESKVIHEDVLQALDTLSRVSITRERGHVQFAYEPATPNLKPPTSRRVG